MAKYTPREKAQAALDVATRKAVKARARKTKAEEELASATAAWNLAASQAEYLAQHPLLKEPSDSTQVALAAAPHPEAALAAADADADREDEARAYMVPIEESQPDPVDEEAANPVTEGGLVPSPWPAKALG